MSDKREICPLNGKEIIRLDEISADDLCTLIADRVTATGAGYDAILELYRRATLPAVPVEELRRLRDGEWSCENLTDTLQYYQRGIDRLIAKAEQEKQS